jgi:hypothetical protein
MLVLLDETAEKVFAERNQGENPSAAFQRALERLTTRR